MTWRWDRLEKDLRLLSRVLNFSFFLLTFLRESATACDDSVVSQCFHGSDLTIERFTDHVCDSANVKLFGACCPKASLGGIRL